MKGFEKNSDSFGARDADSKDTMTDREYLMELFNFSCVLRGQVQYLEEIKERIIKEYVNKDLVKMIKPMYDKKDIYILTETQWEEYQMLKRRGAYLVSAGWP